MWAAACSGMLEPGLACIAGPLLLKMWSTALSVGGRRWYNTASHTICHISLQVH